MTEQFTNLERPPEFRGGDAAAYCRELYRWALKYHLTLEPMVKAAIQLKADIADIGQLSQTISAPPTKSEVEAIQEKVNAVVAAAESTTGD